MLPYSGALRAVLFHDHDESPQHRYANRETNNDLTNRRKPRQETEGGAGIVGFAVSAAVGGHVSSSSPDQPARRLSHVDAPHQPILGGARQPF